MSKRELGWFSRPVARDLGLEAAVLIERLHWRVTKGGARHEHEGRIWWEASRVKLAAECSLTEQRLRTVRTHLGEDGLILTRSSDRTGGRTWWTVNREKLAEMYPVDYPLSSVKATREPTPSSVETTREGVGSSVETTSSSVEATGLRRKREGKENRQRPKDTLPYTKVTNTNAFIKRRRARDGKSGPSDTKAEKAEKMDEWDELVAILELPQPESVSESKGRSTTMKRSEM